MLDKWFPLTHIYIYIYIYTHTHYIYTIYIDNTYIYIYIYTHIHITIHTYKCNYCPAHFLRQVEPAPLPISFLVGLFLVFLHPAAVRCDMVLHRAFGARHLLGNKNNGIGGEVRHGVTSGVSCETSSKKHVTPHLHREYLNFEIRICNTGVCEQTLLWKMIDIEYQPLEHRIRGWRAASAAGLQGKGLRKRSDFHRVPGEFPASLKVQPFYSDARSHHCSLSIIPGRPAMAVFACLRAGGHIWPMGRGVGKGLGEGEEAKADIMRT